jgi:hypothetical protein
MGAESSRHGNEDVVVVVPPPGVPGDVVPGKTYRVEGESDRDVVKEVRDDRTDSITSDKTEEPIFEQLRETPEQFEFETGISIEEQEELDIGPASVLFKDLDRPDLQPGYDLHPKTLDEIDHHAAVKECMVKQVEYDLDNY